MRKESKALYLMVVPALLIFSVFWLYPIVNGVYLSFFQWDGLSAQKTFIGFGNYATAASDSTLRLALINTGLITVGSVVFRLGIGFLLAWVAFSAKRLGRIFYSIVFFPSILSLIIVGTVWKWMFSPNFGIINGILSFFGLGFLTTPWLGNPSTALLGVLIASTWQGIGLYVLLFLVGLQTIPKSMFYAAKIDGLSGFQTIRHAVFPMLRNMFAVNFILCVQSAFGTFDLVYIMTGGGPGRATYTASFYLYRMAFNELRAGYGAAIGVIILAVCFAIMIAYLRVTRAK